MAATHTFSPVASLPIKRESDLKKTVLINLGCFPKSAVNFRKANLKISTRIFNSTAIKTRGHEASSPSLPYSPSMTSFVKHLQDVSMFQLIDPITTTIVENQPTHTHEELATSSGKFVENGLVFRENFSIRSYEIGADGRISMEALMNHLQETGL